jgi:hypothetical protein
MDANTSLGELETHRYRTGSRTRNGKPNCTDIESMSARYSSRDGSKDGCRSSEEGAWDVGLSILNVSLFLE